MRRKYSAKEKKNTVHLKKIVPQNQMIINRISNSMLERKKDTIHTHTHIYIPRKSYSKSISKPRPYKREANIYSIYIYNQDETFRVLLKRFNGVPFFSLVQVNYNLPSSSLLSIYSISLHKVLVSIFCNLSHHFKRPCLLSC